MSPRDAALRMAALAGLWALLTRGDAWSWLLGVPVVIAATFASGALSPAVGWRWRWLGGLRFAAFFLKQSVIGGADVAWRALHPRLPLQPGFVTLRLRLPSTIARVWLANTITLLPGTLSAQLENELMIVHTVDTGAPVTRDVREAEMRIADLLGLKLAPEPGERP
jgi:multicomponent Na+:H+ antiporter subunit E